MALANNLTAILNLVALLCSIPITASGIWLASKPDNECVNLLRWPVVVLGVLILVVSACGFIGAYQYKETLLAVYLCCMAILIGLLLVVLIFAFVVTRPDGSFQVPGRGYKEYRLEGFSSWLRENVVDSCEVWSSPSDLFIGWAELHKDLQAKLLGGTSLKHPEGASMASLREIENRASNDLVNHIRGVFRYFIVDVVDPGSTPDVVCCGRELG
ncbi:Tetraspanin protein [Raphanus sativus]|nr:Tetraspanin protein [Raphanus sativus]